MSHHIGAIMSPAAEMLRGQLSLVARAWHAATLPRGRCPVAEPREPWNLTGPQRRQFREALPEQSFTCDGCGTTHWFTLTPAGQAP